MSRNKYPEVTVEKILDVSQRLFYEKGYEQNKKYGTELDENWNRYELRFRQEMAVSVVQELLRYRDVAGLAMEGLNSKIRFFHLLWLKKKKT